MSMKIVRLEEAPLEDVKERTRDGKFVRRRLLEGTPGSPDNFFLQMVRTYGDFFSPRHHHNFDQFRFQLEGTFSFDRNGTMTPGTVAYFPEGAYYGPQTSAEDSLTVVLQFGGASGEGYMSPDEAMSTTAELKKIGEFKKGAFTQILPDGRKKNKDGFQAVWEHFNKRPLVYPPPRYQDPVFMNPENYKWLALDGAPGVARKRMGVFTECETLLDFFRLEKGASLRLDERSMYFVISGSGRAGFPRWDKHSTLYLARGETGEITADETTELMRIGLPDLAAAAAVDEPKTALAG
jgi:hypothetical protein